MTWISRVMRSLGLGGAIAVVALVPAFAAAQELDRSAMARALFEEGVEFADQERWEEAVDRFRRALELRESSVIEFNLATALGHTGELVESAERLRALLREESADAEFAERVQTLLSQVEPRIPRLRIQVQGTCPECRVELDESPLPEAALDVPIPVDPGAHSIVLHRQGATIARRMVEIDEGAEQTIDIEPPPSEPPSASVPALEVIPPPMDDEESERSGIHTKWWFWTAISAVLVGSSIALALTLRNDGGGFCGNAAPCMIMVP